MSAKIFDYQAEALRIANTFKQKAPPPEDYHDWPEGSYTKGFVKVISLQYHGLFIEQLFTLLNRREISLVIVTHVWRMSSTRMSLLHDFVGSLKPFWGAMLNKKMDRIIMNDELVASLSQDELSRLLNECVAEVGKSNGKPVVVLFNVSEIPYCLSALYFVRDLENLVISCNFLWCIISSSPLVHLYNGRSNEIDEKQYEQIGGHRDEIEEDTEFPGLPLHLWDRKGNLILGTELLTLGSTENCQIKLRPRTHTKMDLAHQLEFAFV